MAFNINAFQQQLGAGARPNLFQVDLGSKVSNESTSFLVTAASLPGRTIGTASAFYRGRELKLAGDMVFAPWTTTILNDTEFKIRDAIESWMTDLIESAPNKTPGSNETGDPVGYFDNITVYQLDKSGEVLRTYRLINAWPSDISEVPLSFDANDQISSFTCTWQYQHIIVVEMGQSSGGGGDEEVAGDEIAEI